MMARVGGGRVKTFSIGFADQGIRRDPLCPDGRRALRHRARGVDRRARRGRGAAAARLALRRAVRRPVGDPDLLRLARWRGATSRSRSTATAATRRFSAIAATRRCGTWRGSTACRAGAAQALARLLALAPPGVQRRAAAAADPRRAARPRPDRPEQRYAGTIVFFARPRQGGGLRRGDARRSSAHSALDLLAPYFAAADGLVAGANWADLHTYLPDDLMVKVDVASMAHGLETRSPLLDHVLLEWAARHPGRGQDGRRHDQGAVQGGDGAVSAARDALSQEDGVRLPDRPMAARTS